MSNRVLVTGGAGFIGSHVVEQLLRLGREVVVLDNFSTGHRHNLPLSHPKLSVVEGCVTDEEVLLSAIQHVDAIIHLAAIVSVQASVDKPLMCHKINVGGTLNVLDVAKRNGVDRIVFASSAAVYGDAGRKAVGESAQTAPLTPYGFDKLSCEQYLGFYAREMGLSSVSLRLFNVYGPRQDPFSDYAGVISRFSEGALGGKPVKIYGEGSQSRDFVYVGDVAKVIIDILDKTNIPARCLNVGTGSSVSLVELLSELEAVLGRKVEASRDSQRAGDIRHSRADTRLLEKHLGYTPSTNLRSGLQSLFEALKVNHRASKQRAE